MMAICHMEVITNISWAHKTHNNLLKYLVKKERVHDLIHLYLICRNAYSDTVSLYPQSLNKYLFFRNTEYTIRPNLCHVIFMHLVKFKSMRWFIVSIFFPFGKALAVMMDRNDNNENCNKSYNVSFCSSISNYLAESTSVGELSEVHCTLNCDRKYPFIKWTFPNFSPPIWNWSFWCVNKSDFF